MTTSSENENIVYTCPMHPEVRSDKPGSCPKCGMFLVPEETKSAHGDGGECCGGSSHDHKDKAEGGCCGGKGKHVHTDEHGTV